MTTDYTKMGTAPFDSDIWGELSQLISMNQLTSQDVLENFMLFYRRVNFAKFLTHIELFKHTIDLPGSVVELGVFKGASFMTFLKLCDVYCAGDSLKKVIGFDTWTGFVDLDEKDGAVNIQRDKVVGGFNAATFLPVLKAAIDIEKRDSMIPRFARAELVPGDCRKTIPEYLHRNPGLRISLLHLDLDLYEPTKVALEHLYDRVVPGGVVILDEYGMEGFPGESQAFDEFFHGNRPKLRKFPFISTPGGYFIKES